MNIDNRIIEAYRRGAAAMYDMLRGGPTNQEAWHKICEVSLDPPNVRELLVDESQVRVAKKELLNTLVRLPDGRVGTICWNHLDGAGGVWGEHKFEMPDTGFGDNLPTPQFMLREKSVEPLLRSLHRNPSLECIGNEFEVIVAG